MWFEKLTGFKEENPEQVRSLLRLENEYLVSLVNGRKYRYGKLEIPTLDELKASAPPLEVYKDRIHISEIVANVQDLHRDPSNNGAIFQAASQFNLLEMVGPSVPPEHGVGIYEKDFTQGPACAIACGAGTIYRNYFVELGGKIGQSRIHQIDCLNQIGKELKSDDLKLWNMQNGYALAYRDGLSYISHYIQNLSPSAYLQLKGKLKIGVQSGTEVTICPYPQLVTQAYCSALPVAYTNIETHYWQAFARLILDATYEATFYAALRNYDASNNNRLYLTLVGGGVFGNELSWILDAIRRSVLKFKHTPLDVRIVSYGKSNPSVRTLVDCLK